MPFINYFFNIKKLHESHQDPFVQPLFSNLIICLFFIIYGNPQRVASAVLSVFLFILATNILQQRKCYHETYVWKPTGRKSHLVVLI